MLCRSPRRFCNELAGSVSKHVEDVGSVPPEISTFSSGGSMSQPTQNVSSWASVPDEAKSHKMDLRHLVKL